MIVVQGPRAIYSLHTNSHSEIRKEFGLPENDVFTRNVQIELTPPYLFNSFDLLDFNAPIETWSFRVDQDQLPAWWDYEAAEHCCRQALGEYLTKVLVRPGEHKKCSHGLCFVVGGTVEASGTTEVVATSGAVFLREHARCRAFGDAQVDAVGHSYVSARDKVNLTLQDNSQANCFNHVKVTAYGNSFAEVYDHANAFLHGNSTCVGHDQAEITAEDDCCVEAHGFCKVDAIDNVRVCAYEECTVSAGGMSSVAAFDAVRVNAHNKAVVITEDQVVIENLTGMATAIINSCNRKSFHKTKGVVVLDRRMPITAAMYTGEGGMFELPPIKDRNDTSDCA